MNKLITKHGDYTLNRLLSGNYPFLVYDAFNQSGKRVIVKMLYGSEKTINEVKDTYQIFQSNDIRTSAWYGHKKASIFEIKGENILLKQYAYLCKSAFDYNISNCILEYDLNDKPILVYDYVNGESFHESKIENKTDFFLRMIPSLLRALSNYPHGDLSFSNLIIHEDKQKFSIIDPATESNHLFFTNTEYYPLVPPLFHPSKIGYTNYADQLAIGLMLYKLLTGINPLKSISEPPFWAKEPGFGNPIGGCISDDIFSVISLFPNWGFSFNFDDYINAIKCQLKIQFPNKIDKRIKFIYDVGIDNYHVDFPSEFFNIIPPKQIYNNISDELSDFCMCLIFKYEPIDWYIKKSQQLNTHNNWQ